VPDRGRQQVEREEMAAGEIFEREQDENERGNFQHPERQHSHGVGNEKLQQRRQHERNHKRRQRLAAGRPDHIIPEAENKNRQRHARHGDERDAPGKEQAQPVPQVINRFEQELADVALTDVCGNLPVILVHRREYVHHGHEQVVKNHLRLAVAAEHAPLPFPRVNRAPKRQHGEQRNETEQRPRQVIDAIRQVVLDPDADDVPVFFHAFALRRQSIRVPTICEWKFSPVD